jgi:hypothetical protein
MLGGGQGVVEGVQCVYACLVAQYQKARQALGLGWAESSVTSTAAGYHMAMAGMRRMPELALCTGGMLRLMGASGVCCSGRHTQF